MKLATSIGFALETLKMRQTGRDPKLNAYAYAEIPDWQLKQWKEDADASQARIQELELALQPFAALGAAYTEHSGAWADEHTVYMFNGIGITLGDIRSAARALHKDSK